jgi:3-dehydroquinate synthase
VGERLAGRVAGRRGGLVGDRAVLGLHARPVLESLRGAGFAVTEIVVPAGEEAKTLAVAERCWDQCLEAGLDRASTLLALGGGAVGDLAGFVAATYMRGIPFVQLPTTVLAQVDASIGGKVAIDHPRAKNLIGAFHQPRLVIADPAVLTTLPDAEFRAGLAEVVKHGIALDAGYFQEVEAAVPGLLARDLPTLERIIAGSCRLKARVVEADERESGLREALNYGHTVGHALEAAAGFSRYLHGQAVAIGIVAAAHLARRLGLADEETVARQVRLLRALGLPVRFREPPPEAIVEAIARDKKARDGRVPFVLAPRLGETRLVFDVPQDLVLDVLAGLRGGAIDNAGARPV